MTTIVSKQDFGDRTNFDNGMISLTDLWREAGSVESKSPYKWQRQESTHQLIETVALMGQRDSKSLWKTKRGGTSPGTYAHKNIALAYAKYLDPKLHVLVNEVFFQRVEEEKNPDLIADRYVKAYQRKGKDQKWIQERFEGRIARNEFTSVLSRHGVDREGFRNCTNMIYIPLFGGTTNVIRQNKGLAKDANIRDNMTSLELASVKFSELLAADNIERNSLHGSAQCEIASGNASRAVANAIIQGRKFNSHESPVL